jgi:hypothetical protein
MGATYFSKYFLKAPVAQWIEQWIPNPCAAGPIPAGGTIVKGRAGGLAKLIPCTTHQA